ncbi:hypothetical protein R1flu_027368 [Riccia fluitans]|uniref:NAD(P)H-quinone oxidoreductase subunit M, chloroplastic n=1 Tax=Riccia fluitans TaxID=41844 RepID=A0ABD1XIL3_9MARC
MASCCSCVMTSVMNVSSCSTFSAGVQLLQFSTSSEVRSSLIVARFQSLSCRNGTKLSRCRMNENQNLRRSAGARIVVRAEGGAGGPVESQSLSYDGPGKGGQWLSATTRHVRIYIGVADPETMALDQSQLDKVTLMLDPDSEFVWPDEQVQKVYNYFAELVENYAGAPCTEYTLRLIGSDIEHYIRKLLLANEIKYNLEAGVLNFSMGLPRYDPSTLEGVEEEAG